MPLDTRPASHPRVAIQGEPGSNSHMAARNVFAGTELTLVPCRASADVFECLSNRSATVAVIPIENSLHGSVFEHYDLLLEHEVQVTGETVLQIRHNLIAAPGVKLDQVKQVMSHPVALSQCRKWLRSHADIEAVPAYDTAGSVMLLTKAGWRHVAAIAPEAAAQEYGAQVLESGIEDHPENYTRFYVLAPRTQPAATLDECDKASLAFTLEHLPGTLVAALQVFERAQLNLTRIESRPVPGKPWEYVFFADVRFAAPEHLDNALEVLKGSCRMVRELGRYHAAPTTEPSAERF